METALEHFVKGRDWDNAAAAAGNLSELHLVVGDLARAEARAREGVEHADRSWDTFDRIVARTQLADALHHRGDFAAAQELVEDAEARQRAQQPYYRLLYSLPGYVCCDLFLEQGAATAVVHHATETLEWATAQGSLLDIALDHLSLGRAHFALGELGSAQGHFDRAIEGLRTAGQVAYIMRGLLARAAFRRAAGELVTARRDVAEALKLVERSGFRLHTADCALEEARIALTESKSKGLNAADVDAKIAEAREALRRAHALVEEMGYGRRRPELAELGRALGESEEPEARA